MFRLLLVLLLLVVAGHAADAPAVYTPQDFTEYGVGPTIFLFVVAAVVSVAMAPICILVWGIFLFIVVKIVGLFGIPPTALLLKLAQRQMMGKGKGLVWQLGILICLPAGVLGLWLSIWMFSLKYHSSSLLVMGSALGVLVAVGFVWLAKLAIGKLKQRFMGGGFGGMGGMGGMNPMQMQMMAQMMKMKDKDRGGE